MSPRGALSQQAFQQAQSPRGATARGSVSDRSPKSEGAQGEQNGAHGERQLARAEARIKKAEADEKSALSSPRTPQQLSPRSPRGRSALEATLEQWEKAESPKSISQQREARDEQLRAVFREFDYDDSGATNQL